MTPGDHFTLPGHIVYTHKDNHLTENIIANQESYIKMYRKN